MNADSFLREKAFPITFKEYNLVFKSIPNGILELMKSYNKQNDIPGVNLTLYINGMDIMSSNCTNKHIRNSIMSSNCTNKHIRNSFLNAKKITPRGNFFWNSLFYEIKWHRALLVPFRFCISNKVRELHLKILYNIYNPTNLLISKFKPVEKKSFLYDRRRIVTSSLLWLYSALHFGKMLKITCQSKQRKR